MMNVVEFIHLIHILVLGTHCYAQNGTVMQRIGPGLEIKLEVVLDATENAWLCMHLIQQRGFPNFSLAVLPRYIAINLLVISREINVHGRKQRYTEIKITCTDVNKEIKFTNEQRISIHLGITVITVQFEKYTIANAAFQATEARCHAPTGATFSKIPKQKCLLAGLAMVGTYDS